MSTQAEEVLFTVTPLTGFEVGVVDPHKYRDTLLAKVGALAPAKTPGDATAAIELAGQTKGLSKRVRVIGKLAREPYNNASSRVIQVENDFCDPLDDATKKAEKIAADFAVAEQKRIDDERAETARLAKIESDKLADLERQRVKSEQDKIEREAAHQRELERMERERAAAEQLEKDAKSRAQKAAAQAAQDRIERERIEAQRIADEAKKKADDEALELQRKAQAAQLDAEFANENAQAAFQNEPAKAKGGATRTGWRIEVTDLPALYAAFPRCVKLTANLPEIKDQIRDLERSAEKEGVENFIPKIPGIVITEETKITARSVAPGLTLH